MIGSGSCSANGPRPDNQDRCAVSPCWAIVSDGLGGHRGGALAAELTVDAVMECLRLGRGRERAVDRALQAANAAVLSGRSVEVSCSEMCATVTFAVVTSCWPESSRWLLTNVGDSPAWLLTACGITRLTEDHNLAAELFRAGTISSDVALRHPGRHMVTRAIGLAAGVTGPRRHLLLRRGEALVIGSDGLSDLMDSGAGALVPGIVAGGKLSPGAQALADLLVDAAIDQGATDNVTAVVLRHL